MTRSITKEIIAQGVITKFVSKKYEITVEITDDEFDVNDLKNMSDDELIDKYNIDDYFDERADEMMNNEYDEHDDSDFCIDDCQFEYLEMEMDY